MNELHPGEVFANRYTIERQLGAGGFSWVYLAHDAQNGRHVALKVLKPERDGSYSRDTQTRFQREVRIIAGLRHPNTVTLHDSGTSPDGALFMVFEHVPGEDLSEVLKREGRLPAAEVIAITEQVLGSLHEAHTAGLVHRDIKPENIRVRSAGDAPIEIKLLDFGVARSTDRSSRLTETGALVGTPRYMSPEQLTDAPLSPASDIYSLGLVALELLVGRQMLGGGQWGDQIDRMRSGHVFSVPMLDSVRPDLVSVVQRMTARRPEDRFARAADVLTALRKAKTPDPVRKAPAPAKPVDSWHNIAWIAVGVFSAAVIGAVSYSADEPQEPVKQTTATPAISSLLKSHQPDVAVIPPPQIAADLTHASAADLAPVEYPDYASPGCGAQSPLDDPAVLLPKGYNPDVPHPVVVWLRTDNAIDVRVPASPRYRAVRDEENFITLMPAPTGNWDYDDQPAIERALVAASKRYCVDRRRIFVTAAGGGGRIAERLACQPWVTAVALVAFASDVGRKNACPNPRPYLFIGARGSVHNPVNGGPDCHGGMRRDQADIVDERKRWNGCVGNPPMKKVVGGAECRSFKCDVPFTECLVDGGRGWPGTPPPALGFIGKFMCNEGDNSQSFDATRYAWDFFAEQKPLPLKALLTIENP